jgi:hypothetical protein
MGADDFVTILTAKGRRATKLIQPAMDRSIWPSKEIPGQIDIVSYDTMTWFKAEEREVSSIYELIDVLGSVERNFSTFVVRGKIADGADRNRMMRRSRSRGEVDPTLLPAAHHWVALDIDAIRHPEFIEPARQPESAAEFVIEQLPAEFHDVTCRWQLTSSQGFKGNTISIRLFFWADRPLWDSGLKTWLCSCEPGTKIRRWPMIDDSVFTPAQPIYTAAPIVCSIRDPVPRRSGILYGDRDEVTPPEIAIPQRSAPGGEPWGAPGVGYDGYRERIGDHAEGDGFHGPVNSAVGAYINRHGSQVDTSWLRTDLEDAIRNAPRDPIKHRDDYIEFRVADLDPLIAAIVDSERKKEAEPESEADNDEPDELALAVEQNLEDFKACCLRAGIIWHD